MLCQRCGATLPEEGDCLACAQARPNLHVPPPPATDPRVAPARPGWRELSPVNKAICILLAIGLAIPGILIVGAVKKEVKWWLWIRPRSTFVIVNESGQAITTATITMIDGPPGRTERRGIVQFESIPVGGKRSRSARVKAPPPRFFVQGRFADGKKFGGGGTSPIGPLRIVIGPDGVDFGKMNYGKPVPARDK